MRKDLLTILMIILFAPCMSLHICAQDSVVVKKQEISREYTKEHPLVFEDAFDIWPYAFNDDKGKALGYNVELVDLLLKELGIPHVTKLKVRKDVLNDLENRRADLTLGMHAPFNEEYTFFAENLNYGKQIMANATEFSDSVVEKVCYNDDEWYCDNGFGGLYSWSEAMNIPKKYDTVAVEKLDTTYFNAHQYIQGICPEGWHIMEEREWRFLKPGHLTNSRAVWGGGRFIRILASSGRIFIRW